jgi:MarR family transcriptional regulator, 2-MHQ and catechol-resistance regulon repressor
MVKNNYLDIEIDALSVATVISGYSGISDRQYPSMASIMKKIGTARRETMRPAPRISRPSGEAATHVWIVLRKATHAIEQNAVRSISALSLGLSEFAVLEVLLHKGPQAVNVIGKKVLLSSGSITAAVDRLESKKLVQRTADTRDLRARIVQLTEKGRRLIERAFQQHTIDMEETLAVLRPGERTELVRLLKKAGMWAAARLEDEGARRD